MYFNVFSLIFNAFSVFSILSIDNEEEKKKMNKDSIFLNTIYSLPVDDIMELYSIYNLNSFFITANPTRNARIMATMKKLGSFNMLSTISSTPFIVLY